MSATTFAQLCIEFCSMAKASVPVLQAEPNGFLAFNVHWRDVTVDVLYDPGTQDHAFALFELGAIDGRSRNPQEILMSLMRANFMSLQINPPTFSCHPDTGAAMLQCVVPLASSTPDRFFAVIDQGVELALEWRKNFFMSDSATHPRNSEQHHSPNNGFA